MTLAIVYGLAVADGLSPVAGAAPFDVLARQLPRFLVARLNGERDRGVRFLPFLGNVDGRRCFLRVRELLPPQTLLTMHRQGAVACVVDGRIHEAGLRLRILGGPGGQVRFEGDLPFDPRAPLDVLPRAEFEVMTALGWHGPPGGTRAPSGEALAWLLVAKDALLALEAGLQMGGDFEPLRAARRCVELLPHDAEAQRLVLDLAAHVMKTGLDRDGAVELLAASARSGCDPEHLERIAGLLEAADARQQSATVLLDVARRWPARTAAVNSAASELFRQGRLDEAAALLRAAVAAGNGEVSVLARLCGIADLLGQRAERDQLCERILAAGEPPVTVVRLLVTFLMEQERMTEALALVGRALQRETTDAALWLEQARILLLLGRTTEARPALERALVLDPEGEAGRDAKRLLRVARQDGLLPELRRVEQLLHKGQLRAALAACRVLCRAMPAASEAWLLLGVLRQKLGQRRRAEKALQHALELEPSLGDAHNRLGILLVARGRVAAGHAHLLQAKALQPWEASVHLHLAQATALLGRHDEGEQHLAEAQRLGADAATVATVRRGFLGSDRRTAD